jgi:hypothetical protein
VRQKTVTYIILSQLFFVVTMAICIALKPQALLHNSAFSFFGNYMPTVIPFVIGLLGMATMLLLAARPLPKANTTDRWLSRLFITIAVHLAGLALIPYGINRVSYIIHISLAYSLGVLFLFASGWLIVKSQRDITNYLLYGIQIAGMVLGILSTSEVGKLHFIALGQLIVIFAFSGLLVRTVAYIEHAEPIINAATAK